MYPTSVRVVSAMVLEVEVGRTPVSAKSAFKHQSRENTCPCWVEHESNEVVLERESKRVFHSVHEGCVVCHDEKKCASFSKLGENILLHFLKLAKKNVLLFWSTPHLDCANIRNKKNNARMTVELGAAIPYPPHRTVLPSSR